MDTFNEINISNIERNTNENVWLDREFEPGTSALLVKFSFTELSRPIKTHDPSRPNYHIPPITKCLPSKKRTTNTVLIDLTNAWLKMVTAPNVTNKRGNI